MSATLQSLGIDKLSLAERFDLLNSLWQNIASEEGACLLSDEQKVDLEQRITEDDAFPNDTISWEQVQSEVQAILGK